MKQLLALHGDLAASRPNDPAISYQRAPYTGVNLTWGDLWGRAGEIRETLAMIGLRGGRISALVLADHPDFIPALIALWQLDSPPLLLDPRWGSRIKASVLSHGTPEFVITVEPSVTATPVNPGSPATAPVDAAFIGYTSGSTGDPKAIVFTHERLHAGTLGNVSASLRLRGDQPVRLGLSMRLSGSGMINVHHVWGAMLGACMVVLPELNISSAREFWMHIERHQIDQAFLVPQLIELVNRFAADRDTSLRGPLFFTGSAPLSPRTQERFQRRFGLPLFNAYGLSETSSAAFFGHLREDGLATTSIGVPERVTARLRDASGRVVDGSGEGEIELAGDQVFEGYFRNPTATAQALADGWLRTGDVARRDDDGRYFLIGRTKDVVTKGGYAIYLSEIEEAAAAQPDVLEAAAVPLRLADSVEDIGCLVRLVEGRTATAAEILSSLRRALGVQRAPCRVAVTTEPLPRIGLDKLDRPAIIAFWNTLPHAIRSFEARRKL